MDQSQGLLNGCPPPLDAARTLLPPSLGMLYTPARHEQNDSHDAEYDIEPECVRIDAKTHHLHERLGPYAVDRVKGRKNPVHRNPGGYHSDVERARKIGGEGPSVILGIQIDDVRRHEIRAQKGHDPTEGDFRPAECCRASLQT